MRKYKKKFDSKIYKLNYDDLVTHTENEIENLIGWLRWKYNKKYLKPNLDKSTTKVTKGDNSITINKEELYSWKNYQEILKPALEIFSSDPKLKKLIKY